MIRFIITISQKKRFLYLFEINAITFKIINKFIRYRLDSFLIINYIRELKIIRIESILT